MKVFLRVAAAFLLVTTLGACASTEMGSNFREENASQIRSGTTTKEQVAALFKGQSKSTSKDGTDEIWTFQWTHASVTNKGAAMGAVGAAAGVGLFYAVPILGVVAAGAGAVAAYSSKPSVAAQGKILTIQFRDGVVASCRLFTSNTVDSQSDSETSYCGDQGPAPYAPPTPRIAVRQ